MPLKDSIAILAATPPPAQERKQALADANAKITALEAQLGLAHKLMPIFNPARAAARLAELQGQLAAKGVTSAPAAAVPAPAPRPVEKTGDAMTDAAVLAAGVPNLRALKAKAKRDQLFATAANLPSGTLARACAESNLAKAQAELNESL
jgi:hypothetical protein